MAVYQSIFSIAGVNTADGVLFNLKAGAADRVELLEVGFFIEVLATNAPQFGLKRMNAVGTGAITAGTIEKSDPADGASAATFETAWATTRPTVTGGSLRKAAVAGAIGNGVIFDFTNRPIVIPVSAALCGLMLNAAGATLGQFGGYAVWRD